MSDFSNAKPGDKVFLESGGWGRVMVIRTIEKVGKIHFTLVGIKQKYRVNSGREAGDCYSREYVKPYNEQEWQEYLAEKELKKMRYDLRDFRWMDCDAELITKVHALTHPVETHSGRSE